MSSSNHGAARDPAPEISRSAADQAKPNRVRELRSSRSWTQVHLADRLAVSRQTVIALEGGRHYPSLEVALRIAEVFDTPVEEVFAPANREEL